MAVMKMKMRTEERGGLGEWVMISAFFSQRARHD